MSGDKFVKVGQVYTRYLEQIERWCVCHVVGIGYGDTAVGIGNEEPLVIIRWLDWYGESKPNVEAIKDCGQLYFNYMNCNNSDSSCIVPAEKPCSFTLIGQLLPPAFGECRSWGGWDNDLSLISEFYWRKLDHELRDGFKQRYKLEITTSLPGVLHSNGSQVEVKIDKTSFQEKFYQLDDSYSLESLSALTYISQLGCQDYRTGLEDFLSTHPLLWVLQLSNCSIPVLDLSNSYLHELSINVTGMRRLILPQSLSRLVLHGVPSNDFYVDAANRGKFIDLHVDASCLHIKGLEQVKTLNVWNIIEESACAFWKHFPEVEFLYLRGKPGIFYDMQGLPFLAKLKVLCIYNLFGFDSVLTENNNFPLPADWPALEKLSLDSVPATLIKVIKKTYGKTPLNATGKLIQMNAVKGRGEKWLAENLYYPLRDWDGRDGINPSTARKIHQAYKKALTAIRNLTDTEAKDKQNQILTIAKNFIDIIACENRKDTFVYTLESDEITTAVQKLTDESLDKSHWKKLNLYIETQLD